MRDEICLRFSSVGRLSLDNILLTLLTTSEAIIIEYVSYGPVLDHFNFVYVFFLPGVPYRGRIFN